ncbi:syntaxin-11-like [Alosa sapidissima]|uniref:syntaxin-11-like n=1 Tax=Alosa sapidissima TaxID=34773 RepID=UPI001C0A5D79|nr:syntaxin-11-like [Alosa sapidissima]XP_041950882.1 syntaxin-11-like [Alosa sapidissima]
MRDRLSHLQALSESEEHLAQLEESEYGEDAVSVATVSVADTFTSVDLEEDLAPQAVVWDNGEEVEEVLVEAQEVRREVQMMRLDVRRLREQNARLLSEPTRTTTIKRDSNAIAGDIKTRGQDTLARLRKMDAHARELEDEHGVNSAVARIARTQYACLSNGFRDAMADYNAAEMSHRDTCKAHIQRQMEIVGRDVSGEQIEEMLEGGRWNVFADNVLAEGKTARSALGQIERRHQELLELESRVRSVHEVFLDVAMLVEEQGPMLDAIHTHVQKTDAQLGEALVRLGRANKHDKSNPFKKMFCGCFPCYK